jgi:hypothetical protein
LIRNSSGEFFDTNIKGEGSQIVHGLKNYFDYTGEGEREEKVVGAAVKKKPKSPWECFNFCFGSNG